MNEVIRFLDLKRAITRFRINLRYSFNIEKPLLICRLVKNYLCLLLGRIPLRYIDVAVDYICNQNCRHCSASKLANPLARKLSLAEYRNLAEQCLNLGAITIGFTGGEPTLDSRITDIIKAFQPNKIMISLITNATTLDSEKIKKFKKLGVDILCASIDSYSEKEHDKFRRMKGAYAKAFKSIKEGLENGLKIVIVTTVTHQNLHSANTIKLIELTKKMKVLLIFGLACPAGNWSKEKEFLLTEGDIAFMNKLFQKYPHVRRDFGSNWLEEGCGAGKEKLYFTPYGDVIPCPFIHISFGNVRESSVREIQKRNLSIPEFRHYHSKCLSGEDFEFSRKYVCRANSAGNPPVFYKKIFFDRKL